MKVCAGGGMPKVLGRDYEIEKPYWGPFSVIMSSIFTEYVFIVIRNYYVVEFYIAPT